MTRYLKLHSHPPADHIEHLPEGALTPMQVCKAYGLPKVVPIRKPKLGIVSLGGEVNDSDLATAFATYQLPKPRVIVSGTPNSEIPGTRETMLDVECLAAVYSYCTGEAADIQVHVEKPPLDGIAPAIDCLVAAGCEVISISWGWPASEQSAETRAKLRAACKKAAQANCHLFAASGDWSQDSGTDHPTPDEPCCDPNVWGVGGTSLRLNDDGSIASESVWGDGSPQGIGSGGGFDKTQAMPNYQKGVVPGEHRGCPDSSAHADITSGYAVYLLGKWFAIGGTSASAPFTAGYIASVLASLQTPPGQALMQDLLYKHYRTAFNDITTGSDGAPAVPGWDQASGCGSINGKGMLDVLQGNYQ